MWVTVTLPHVCRYSVGHGTELGSVKGSVDRGDKDGLGKVRLGCGLRSVHC